MAWGAKPLTKEQIWANTQSTLQNYIKQQGTQANFNSRKAEQERTGSLPTGPDLTPIWLDPKAIQALSASPRGQEMLNHAADNIQQYLDYQQRYANNPEPPPSDALNQMTSGAFSIGNVNLISQRANYDPTKTATFTDQFLSRIAEEGRAYAASHSGGGSFLGDLVGRVGETITSPVAKVAALPFIVPAAAGALGVQGVAAPSLTGATTASDVGSTGWAAGPEIGSGTGSLLGTENTLSTLANGAAGTTAGTVTGTGITTGTVPLATGQTLTSAQMLEAAAHPAAFMEYMQSGMIPVSALSTVAGLASTLGGAIRGQDQNTQSTLLGSLGNLLSGNGSAGSTGSAGLGNVLGALASGGASLYGADQAATAAREAAQIQAQSGANALAEAKRQFDLGQTNQQPWMTAGKTALGSQLDLMGLPGGTTGSSTNALSELQNSPGYQFRLGEGQRALERSAAARGETFSGSTGRALTEYGQNFATNEYGNRLNQLAGLSGTGQSAASGMANQGANYAANQGNTLMSMGNAQAAGTIGAGNAWQSGTLGVGNALSNLFNPPQRQPSFRMVNGNLVYQP